MDSNSLSRLARIFAEAKPDYPIEVRQAWTQILISCWEEGNDAYIEAMRAEPLSKLEGIAIIDESEGKYFPLPSKPPEGIPNPDSAENEATLRAILAENSHHFGQMMMGGGWSENEGEVWIDIIIRAWKEPEFLQRLRNDPKKTLDQDYLRIRESLGKFFPISKEKPEALKGCSEEELRKELNDAKSEYMGWMMTCCR